MSCGQLIYVESSRLFQFINIVFWLAGFGIGKYMFIEASLPRRPGHKARLYSERFTPTSRVGRCIKFWYHMYGNAIGTLNVLVKTGAGSRSEDIVWTLSGNQQNQQSTWNFGQTTVASVQSAYQVKVQTKHGCACT